MEVPWRRWVLRAPLKEFRTDTEIWAEGEAMHWLNRSSGIEELAVVAEVEAVAKVAKVAKVAEVVEMGRKHLIAAKIPAFRPVC